MPKLSTFSGKMRMKASPNPGPSSDPPIATASTHPRTRAFEACRDPLKRDRRSRSPPRRLPGHLDISSLWQRGARQHRGCRAHCCSETRSAPHHFYRRHQRWRSCPSAGWPDTLSVRESVRSYAHHALSAQRDMPPSSTPPPTVCVVNRLRRRVVCVVRWLRRPLASWWRSKALSDRPSRDGGSGCGRKTPWTRQTASDRTVWIASCITTKQHRRSP